MKNPIKRVEEITGYKVKRNITSIGFDWASRAGISLIQTTSDEINIGYIFVDFKGLDRKEKYKMMIEKLEEYIEPFYDIAIVESVFVGFNPKGALELAKYHAFAIAECIKKKVNYETIMAKDCRARLGIKTTKKAGYGKGLAKKAVADYLENNFGIKLEDEDASDAIILALLGVLEGVKFE